MWLCTIIDYVDYVYCILYIEEMMFGFFCCLVIERPFQPWKGSKVAVL